MLLTIILITCAALLLTIIAATCYVAKRWDQILSEMEPDEQPTCCQPKTTPNPPIRMKIMDPIIQPTKMATTEHNAFPKGRW